MKSVLRARKKQLILFSIALLLCGCFWGAMENVRVLALPQDEPRLPHAATIPYRQANYSDGVSVPFFFFDEIAARKSVSDRILASSGKTEKTKREPGAVSLPFPKGQGNVLCGFGTWRYVAGRSLTVFSRHIIITYMHLQDGLK